MFPPSAEHTHTHATARWLRLKSITCSVGTFYGDCEDSHSLAFVVRRERVDSVGKRLILELASRVPGSGYYPEVPALELNFPYAFGYL